MTGSLWMQMGVIHWPLALSLAAVVVLTVWSCTTLFRPGAWADVRSRAWVDAILFWGGFAMITGVLGTVLGVILAAQAIEAAGAVMPALVWGGIKVAMLSSAAGFTILAFAALSWFGLQLRWRLLAAREDAAEA